MPSKKHASSSGGGSNRSSNTTTTTAGCSSTRGSGSSSHVPARSAGRRRRPPPAHTALPPPATAAPPWPAGAPAARLQGGPRVASTSDVSGPVHCGSALSSQSGTVPTCTHPRSRPGRQLALPAHLTAGRRAPGAGAASPKAAAPPPPAGPPRQRHGVPPLRRHAPLLTAAAGGWARRRQAGVQISRRCCATCEPRPGAIFHSICATLGDPPDAHRSGSSGPPTHQGQPRLLHRHGHAVQAQREGAREGGEADLQSRHPRLRGHAAPKLGASQQRGSYADIGGHHACMAGARRGKVEGEGGGVQQAVLRQRRPRQQLAAAEVRVDSTPSAGAAGTRQHTRQPIVLGEGGRALLTNSRRQRQRPAAAAAGVPVSVWVTA